MTETGSPKQESFDQGTTNVQSNKIGASADTRTGNQPDALMSTMSDTNRKPDTSVLQHAAEQLWSKLKADNPPSFTGAAGQPPARTVVANLLIITTGKSLLSATTPNPSSSSGSSIPIKLELLTNVTQAPPKAVLAETIPTPSSSYGGTVTSQVCATGNSQLSTMAVQSGTVQPPPPPSTFSSEVQTTQHPQIQLSSSVTTATVKKEEPTEEVGCNQSDRKTDALSQTSDSSNSEPQSTATRTGQYTCWTCRQHFQSHTGLKRHNLALHVTHALPCDQCVKVFRHPNALADHKKRVHGPREYVCGVCSADFATESYLRTHVRIHEEKQFCCSECKHCFSNHTDLKNHMRVHNGEKPFTCEVCGKSFRHVSGFYAHIRIHTGETPYNCEQCDKKFSNASNYRMHMKVHTKEMRFRCETCGKEFIQPSNYSRHLRIHTKERPYACNLCSAQFPYSTSLKRHQQRDHGLDLLSCRVCSKTFLNETSLIRHRTGCELRACVTSTGAELCAQLL